MKLCSCGLPMRTRIKALICDHCDGTRVHDARGCSRCRAIGLVKPRP